MFKKVGFFIIGVVFLGTYIATSLRVFSGSNRTIHYVQDEIMFGSVTLLGMFIFMSIILFIFGIYIIGLLFEKKK